MPSNANNQIAVRHYVTEGDYNTYRVGDWRRLPRTFNFGGRDLPGFGFEIDWKTVKKYAA